MNASELLAKSADKQRIVITGSQGVPFVTALVVHVLRFHQRKVDVVRTSQPLEGTARLTHAPILIVEGMVNPEPGWLPFNEWNHHVAVLTAMKWSPDMPFASEEEYLKQYDTFTDRTPKGGIIVFNETDRLCSVLCNKERPDVQYVGGKAHPHEIAGNEQFLVTSQKTRIGSKIAGKHEWVWVSLAKELLKKIGITSEQFYQAFPSFTP
ncbi:MAG: hypothetical protein ACK5DD_03715 [Cyclobacteriaceae bacterium]|jgi:UDP-N-acetylmuramate: L-alanyl-gamma-D-glutamyl-meso-diaminopimelate ligase